MSEEQWFSYTLACAPGGNRGSHWCLSCESRRSLPVHDGRRKLALHRPASADAVAQLVRISGYCMAREIASPIIQCWDNQERSREKVAPNQQEYRGLNSWATWLPTWQASALQLDWGSRRISWAQGEKTLSPDVLRGKPARQALSPTGSDSQIGSVLCKAVNWYC